MSRAPITSEGPKRVDGLVLEASCVTKRVSPTRFHPQCLLPRLKKSRFYTHLSNDEPRCPLIATHKAARHKYVRAVWLCGTAGPDQ
jgi:hypothetical protein